MAKVLDPRLCSCHFDGSFDYPVPHYMPTKRTFTDQDDEPKPKYSKYEYLDENETENTISLNEWLLDSSVEYLGDFKHDGSRDVHDPNYNKSEESLNSLPFPAENLSDTEYIVSPPNEKVKERDKSTVVCYDMVDYYDEDEQYLNSSVLSAEYLSDIAYVEKDNDTDKSSVGRDAMVYSYTENEESLNGSFSALEYLSDVENITNLSIVEDNDAEKSNVDSGFMDSCTQNSPIQEAQIVNMFGNNNELTYSEFLVLDDSLFSTPKTKKKYNLSTIHPDNYFVIEVDNVTEDKSKIDMKNSVVTQSLFREIRMLKEENKSMKIKIEVLTKRLINMNLNFEFAFIENSDEKVFLHTGLPNKLIFDLVFGLMSRFDFDYVMGWAVRIPKKTQFLMTLIKLRMDLRYFDISQRFGISIATISNIFRTWVLAMHEILFLQLMKQIPTRFKNNECLPAAFKTLVDCKIILDCTELFTDKPHKMSNQSAIYSTYKHHVTSKGLIGIAPNGVTTYSSDLYPGSLSDKKIVQHCGITDQLVLGDNVLADKGFLIRDDLPYGVNLNMPPFLTTPQFTAAQVRLTEFFARARVHVERAVNKVKNFRILHYLPAEFFSIANEIFQVCVALTNFQYPLIREVAPYL